MLPIDIMVPELDLLFRHPQFPQLTITCHGILTPGKQHHNPVIVLQWEKLFQINLPFMFRIGSPQNPGTDWDALPVNRPFRPAVNRAAVLPFYQEQSDTSGGGLYSGVPADDICGMDAASLGEGVRQGQEGAYAVDHAFYPVVYSADTVYAGP